MNTARRLGHSHNSASSSGAAVGVRKQSLLVDGRSGRERCDRIFAHRISDLCREWRWTDGQLAIALDLDRKDANAIRNGGRASATQLMRVLAHRKL